MSSSQESLGSKGYTRKWFKERESPTKREREEHEEISCKKSPIETRVSIECLPSRDDKRQDKSVKWPLGSFFLWFSYKVYMETCHKTYIDSQTLRHKDYSYTHVLIFSLKSITWNAPDEEIHLSSDSHLLWHHKETDPGSFPRRGENLAGGRFDKLFPLWVSLFFFFFFFFWGRQISLKKCKETIHECCVLS